MDNGPGGCYSVREVGLCGQRSGRMLLRQGGGAMWTTVREDATTSGRWGYVDNGPGGCYSRLVLWAVVREGGAVVLQTSVVRRRVDVLDVAH